MRGWSEKARYSDLVKEKVPCPDNKIFIWGEELYDRKLVLYSGSLQKTKEPGEMKENLKPCSLVFADEEKEKFLYCIPANIDIKNGNAYLSEQNFNRHWKKLKRSVKRGMDSSKMTGNASGEEKPEDIVVLDNLIRQNSIPCIRKDVIQYESRPLSAEELRRQSRRQSLLDNPEMNYYYAEGGRYYHDKECPEVKRIPLEKFCASGSVPAAMDICPKCRRRIYLRKACAPHTKQIQISLVCGTGGENLPDGSEGSGRSGKKGRGIRKCGLILS